MINKAVLTEKKDSTYFITLNRPQKKNSLTREMVLALADALESIPANCRSVLIKGSEGAFCAGADLEWVKLGISQDRATNIQESLELVTLLEKIKNLHLPVISLVEGPAIGAGAGIVLASDFRIISTNATFGFSEVKIGVVPVAIIDMVMQAFPNSIAKDLLLTGKRLSGTQAAEHGMTHHIFTTLEEKEKILMQVTSDIENAMPQALALTKSLINSVQAGKAPDSKRIATLIADLRESEETKEGIENFFNKR